MHSWADLCYLTTIIAAHYKNPPAYSLLRCWAVRYAWPKRKQHGRVCYPVATVLATLLSHGYEARDAA